MTIQFARSESGKRISYLLASLCNKRFFAVEFQEGNKYFGKFVYMWEPVHVRGIVGILYRQDFSAEELTDCIIRCVHFIALGARKP